jgi:predicted phosphoribosyltransferase
VWAVGEGPEVVKEVVKEAEVEKEVVEELMETFSDIDDDEVEDYLHTNEESQLKEIIWRAMNKVSRSSQ